MLGWWKDYKRKTMMEHRVIYMKMPVDAKGFVIKTFDEGEDYVTVVLNPCYNWEQQRDTYEHELKHIEAKDLDNYGDADELEAIRHA